LQCRRPRAARALPDDRWHLPLEQIAHLHELTDQGAARSRVRFPGVYPTAGKCAPSARSLAARKLRQRRPAALLILRRTGTLHALATLCFVGFTPGSVEDASATNASRTRSLHSAGFSAHWTARLEEFGMSVATTWHSPTGRHLLRHSDIGFPGCADCRGEIGDGVIAERFMLCKMHNNMPARYLPTGTVLA
jgi:hypothetical protein